MTLGQYIKEARAKKGLSQWDLATLSGLNRSHLSRLELDNYKHSSAETFLALARAFEVSPRELYEAAGYIENAGQRGVPPRDVERALSDFEMPRLARIPVYSEIHSEVSDVVGHVYWGLPEHLSENMVGLLAKGFRLEQDIDVREGDVVLVDRDIAPSPGNIVVRYQDEAVHLIRYSGTCGSNGGGESDGHIYGVVIGVNRILV